MHCDPELRLQTSWRSSKDLAEHVVPVSRALRFTDGAGVAFESGSVPRRPGRSSNKHTSLAERIRPQKACIRYYSRAEWNTERLSEQD
jgi:hypothetical protein